MTGALINEKTGLEESKKGGLACNCGFPSLKTLGEAKKILKCKSHVTLLSNKM